MFMRKQCENNQNTVALMPQTNTLYPLFDHNQIKALSMWNLSGPVGLSVRISTDHDYCFEVATLYQGDTKDARYMIYPKDQMRVVLVQLRRDKWEMSTLETALGKVVSLEQWNAAA